MFTLARTRRLPLLIASLTGILFSFANVSASASASTAISGREFGMHYLNPSNPLLLGFGSARIWDMGVTWKDLQPTSGATNASVLSRLDSIVNGMRNHGAQPMITLGMTPNWAAHHCNHWSGGVNWGLQTCAPTSQSTTGSWGRYVRMLASRYKGKVATFELWNEPSLHNGYNDSLIYLARMQRSAQTILHQYGEKLVSPSIPFTDGNGTPKHGLSWLKAFFKQSGGHNFDIVGLHLYPNDASARAGYGPEWAMSALSSVRAVLRQNSLSAKPIWNTETNVGRKPAHSTIGGGTRGAAMVARTYLLATQNGVARTFWYAADDQTWGGTWLESSDARSLTPAGYAYAAVRHLLIGAHPRGCSRTTVGTHKWHYACKYRLSNGQGMIAVWSTGTAFTYHGPKGMKRVEYVTGGGHAASHATKLSVGAAPVYVIGSFKV